MYDLLSAQEIRKRFLCAIGKNFSLQSIHHMADKIGYKERRFGGKKGYHKSLYTALTQHLKELMEYDEGRQKKACQRPKKQPKEITWNDGNYFTYNGERDNIDYEWEKNESIIKKAILESINELELLK